MEVCPRECPGGLGKKRKKKQRPFYRSLVTIRQQYFSEYAGLLNPPLPEIVEAFTHIYFAIQLFFSRYYNHKFNWFVRRVAVSVYSRPVLWVRISAPSSHHLQKANGAISAVACGTTSVLEYPERAA